ncbi:ATP-binding protein [Desulfoluna butyratoxydans]|uniref:Helicase hera central domain n=1 Tax=Desulfoluna butyratoxydans TaxID=231438 RepID=A0A4U8YTZ2_9BACT|nr:ATP-binding protein [Desulfoluna butyratoxydans]VFQ47441.1 helicase hera central domain [Desulfoluna butyratoxydans]
MDSDITYLGKIIRVDSSTVEVEVSDDIPSSAPIINGRLYKIGQIGTFVKMPMGNIITYGIVSSVSNTPSKQEDNQTKQIVGSRFLSVQLIGEKIGDDDFEKGIGTYPTINDEVHLVVEQDLFDIYGEKNAGSIEIGKHSSSDNLSVYVDIHKLILRHCAILGSTGSGKSNTTVSILKAILDDYLGSRIILVDPHGEYASAFPKSKVFRINDSSAPLNVPFWLMTFDELAFFLVGAKPTDDQRPEYRLLREWITNFKKEHYQLKSGNVNPDFITADSPIPFSVRKLWYEMNWWLNATFSESTKDKQTKDTVELAKDENGKSKNGDYENLKPAEFKPYPMGNSAPYKSKHQDFYSYEKKLLSRLKDSRFDFMFHPGDYKDISSSKDLHDLLNDWIGSESKLAILDLSGVPFEILDITIGLITRFVYDSMFWGRNKSYTGKNRPILLAYEEAHTYLSKNDNNSYSKNAVERIFKEGRKFGVGALVISQRPSEISETILAQLGTLIALRLTNSGDQSIVKSSSPDNLNSLIDLLPSLRIGEAVIVGESIKIPSRVRIKLNNPRPTSEDPKLVECWSKKHEPCDDNYKSVVTNIREQRINSTKGDSNG